MDFDKFQYEATGTCMETAFCLDYLVPGLVAEAGEVAGKYAKYIRDQTLYTDLQIDMGKELGDTTWFIAVLCEKLGLDFSKVAQGVLDKLNSRAKRGTLGGSGDER